MSKIYIQPDTSNFDSYLSFAVENGYNMEIASFALSNVLDSDWYSIAHDYKNKLKGFKGNISMHGTFHDLILHSRDAKISGLARERYIQNLEIAKEFGAKFIVFHGNYNPMIKHVSYKNNWVKINSEFWVEAAEKYKITILIENLWEPDPEMFVKLLDEAKSERLKICFDTGHANIFSEVKIGEWFDALRDNICYIHANDNLGELDSELAPGEGSINWNEFNNTINKYNLSPEMVFEVGSIEKVSRSIKYLKENKIYPF